ncbi:hypothetical protein ACWEC4_44480 [Streptomyces sp. NPDC005055]
MDLHLPGSTRSIVRCVHTTGVTSSQRERYAAATQAEPVRRLGALSTAEAEAELAQATGTDLSDLALPDLIPPVAPPTTEPK